MGTTGLTPAGRYADPTGRHLYRWWDGSGWTDRVGDGAQEFQDPFGHEIHPVPTAPAPTWAGPAWAPPVEPVGPVGAGSGSGRRWGWIIGALVAAGVVVVAVVAVGVFVLVQTATGPIVDEDFSDGAGRFSTDSDNLVDLEAVDGVYRVTLGAQASAGATVTTAL